MPNDITINFQWFTTMGNKKNDNIILTHEEWRQMKEYYGIDKKVFKIVKNNIKKNIRRKKNNENI